MRQALDTNRMNRNPSRQLCLARAAALLLSGTEVLPAKPAEPRGGIIPSIAPVSWPASSPPPPLRLEGASGAPAPGKTRGRPRGGIRDEARRAGVPTATYRRRLLADRLRVSPAVAEAIAAAPVELSQAARLRILRAGDETAMLTALEAEVAARKAPRSLSLRKRLEQRVAALEAENAALKAELSTLRAPPSVQRDAEAMRKAAMESLREYLAHDTPARQTSVENKTKPLSVAETNRSALAALGYKPKGTIPVP